MPLLCTAVNLWMSAPRGPSGVVGFTAGELLHAVSGLVYRGNCHPNVPLLRVHRRACLTFIVIAVLIIAPCTTPHHVCDRTWAFFARPGWPARGTVLLALACHRVRRLAILAVLAGRCHVVAQL